MRALRRFLLRLSGLITSRRDDRRLTEEVEEHLALQTAANIKAGMSPVEARRQAVLKFGAVESVKEDYRDQRTLPIVESLFQDIRYALRGLRRNPGFTTVAVLTLALGVGANAAVFSIVNAVYLKKLPIKDAARLVEITGEEWFATSVWEHIRDHQDLFESVAAIGSDRFNLARGGPTRYAPALVVSGRFFEILGIPAAVGRVLNENDDRPGAPAVIVVSHTFWRRELAARSDAIGETIWVEGQPFRLVGVTPREFLGVEVGKTIDLFVPIVSLAKIPSRTFLLQPDATWWKIFARLRPTQTVETAAAMLRSWQPRVAEATKPSGVNADRHLVTPLGVRPAGTGISEVRQFFGSAMLLMLAIVGAVLLITCANLSGLVLARFIDRSSELSVRRALGASVGELIRSVLVENLLLAIAGAVLGGILAIWATAYIIPQLTPPEAFRQIDPYLDVAADWRVFAVMIALMILTVAVMAAVPVFRTYRFPSVINVSSGQRTQSASWRETRTMRVLLTGQVGLSLVMVAVAGLLVRSFVALTTQDLGFDHSRVLLTTVSGNLGPTGEAQIHTVENIRQRLSQLPAVEAATASLLTPISGQLAVSFVTVPGADSDGVRVFANRVAPDYFRVYSTRILAGRAFDDGDTEKTSPVAIVNQEFAVRYFGTTNPVGRTIILNKRPATVIGVTANAKHLTLRDNDRPFVYAPIAQWGVSKLEMIRFALRTANPASLNRLISETIRSVNPELSVENRALTEDVSRSVNVDRLLAWCGAMFGTLALMIGMIGTYGVFSYAVARRQHEIGIRMALGATPASIVRDVIRETVVVMLAGVSLGIAATWAAGHFVERFLFGFTGRDITTIAGATLVILLAAFLAVSRPARRASRVDPLVALRYE